ncbi:MAG: hypothetical protein JWN99_2233 [Ilumatobacteraceae bacterium]|jgi:hypothetical protein|nr:hypothetical protein [Ilumatobacteraceae bacterium]
MAGQAESSQTFTIVGDHVVGEVFDGEAIIIDTITGAYYSLADGAAQVWSALAAGATTFGEIHAASGGDARLVLAVLSELVEAQLVLTEAPMPPRPDDALAHLTKYSDMEELLLLDPIHDVAPAGWPVEGIAPPTSFVPPSSAAPGE